MIFARLQFLLPTAALAIFIGALGAGFYSQRNNDAIVHSAGKENLYWTVAQLELETLHFLNALERFGRGDTETGKDTLLTRLDILWSRLGLFTKGDVGRRLLSFPESEAYILALLNFLEREERNFSTLEPANFEAIDRIEAELRHHLENMHGLAVRVMHAEERRIADLRDQQRANQVALQLFAAGAILSGGLLLLAMLRGKRKSMQQAADMRNLVQKTQAANRSKSEFLAMMSHEVRTPLNGILGMISLLLEGKLDHQQRHYAESARHSGEALFEILNDILDFSRLEAGKLAMEEKVFDLEKLVHNIVQLFGPQAKQRGLFLSFEMLPGVPRYVKGDPGRLRQVILNLVGNAMKFTRRGGVSIQISAQETEYDLEDGTISLSVIVNDTGIGIAEDKLDSIFDPFSQADAQTNRKFGGTGLGLAICKRLVRLMDGTITCRSASDIGSTFTFTARVRVPMEDEIPHVSASPKAAPASRPRPGTRVLVAEDSPTNLELVVVMLETLDCEVTTATNGEEALAILEQADFDLILMDVQMPELDGFEATARIRDMAGPKKDLPIIALTANAMKGDRERCLAAGMDDYISKPMSRDDLQRKVAQWASPRAGAQPDEQRGVTTCRPFKLRQAAQKGAAVLPDAVPAEDMLDHDVLDRLKKEVGAEAVARMLTRFLSEMPERLEAIREGLTVGSEEPAVLTKIQRHCHSLKSAAAAFGALPLSRLAAEMEAAAKEGDWQACRGHFASLPQLVSRTRDAATRLQATLQGAREGMPAG